MHVHLLPLLLFLTAVPPIQPAPRPPLGTTTVRIPHSGSLPQQHASLHVLALRGGFAGGAVVAEGPIHEDDAGITMYRHHQGGLEPPPTFSLKTTDQDFGVDYGCNAFMFEVRCKNRPLVITGMQICSADGSPYDYKVATTANSWPDAMTDESVWSICGGGNRLYIPDHTPGEYGCLPWAMAGVRVEVGESRAFVVWSKDNHAAVGYRVVGEVETCLARRVGRD
eukprot:CAMPEP_0173399744 /NCGR_PEP_ID=MMETSP1356-20130122/45777_1 /TAXON_ID=77927 ORGANISM="Hemiselmis virescens, Strain PCC157" /NCGR_SAMPLE_ID=MMETSP1356 /ASSEMBLY_ACC=CAM_ASM_000847 /LENGTH=223 /DNA_ID=CAMNT_0014359509 /DNA_START=112 /DNA_END=780 /DNA_ORIENTATION=+